MPHKNQTPNVKVSPIAGIIAPKNETAEDKKRAVPLTRTSPKALRKLKVILESILFQRILIGLIVINAIIMGLETNLEIMNKIGPYLIKADQIILGIFIFELLAKLLVYRLKFHKDPWNVFDFIVISIALVPATGSLSVLRAFRVLRVLRLVSAVPSMRRVVQALLAALPGMGSIIGLLSLMFYIFAVMATKIFGSSFPEWFGNLANSSYTLFQIMTLESWSMGIVRPVMEVYPHAWMFFVPFILITSFTVLNLFIGIIVDAMQSQHRADELAELAEQGANETDDRQEILDEIRALRADIADLKANK